MAMTTVLNLMDIVDPISQVQRETEVVPLKPSKPRKTQILWTAATGTAEVAMLLSHTCDY